MGGKPVMIILSAELCLESFTPDQSLHLDEVTLTQYRRVK